MARTTNPWSPEVKSLPLRPLGHPSGSNERCIFILHITNPKSFTKYNNNRTLQIIQSFRVATLDNFQVFKSSIMDILEDG